MNGDAEIAESEAQGILHELDDIRGKVDCVGFPPMLHAVKFATRCAMATRGDVHSVKTTVDALALELKPIPTAIAALVSQAATSDRNARQNDINARLNDDNARQQRASIKLPNGMVVNLFGEQAIRGVLHFVTYGGIAYLIAKQHGWVP